MKAQNAVLKKAVLQEQQKSQTLEASVKEREIRLRAALEENDTLSFNNQRLTKRVEVLQSSMEEEKTRASSSGWFGGAAKQELQKTKESMAILQEELDTKIKETESIHMRMFEERKEHANLVQTLADKLEKIKVQLLKKNDEYEDLSSEHKHVVSKLAAEKSDLIGRVEELSDTLQRTKGLMQQREHSMTQLQQKLTAELESVQAVVAQKLPFDDSRTAALNPLNLPTFDRAIKTKRDVLLANLTGPTCKKVSEVFREMLDSEREKALLQNANRSLELPEAIRHCNRKLISALADVSQLTTRVLSSLAAPSSQSATSSTAPQLEASLQRLVLSFSKVRSYRCLKLQLEASNALKIASSAHHDVLLQNEDKFHAAISKFVTYACLYHRMTDVAEGTPSKWNAGILLRKMLTLIARLRDVLRERSTAFSARVAMESQLDPFLQPEIKLLNEKSLVSISSLLALLDKTAAVMDQWIGLASTPSRFAVRGSRLQGSAAGGAVVAPLAGRVKSFLSAIHASSELNSPSIPYQDQLLQANRVVELSHEVSERDSRIQALSSSISQLENEKTRLLQDITTAKDQLASKQGSLTELLGELADTRQKLSHTATLHQRQSARVKELEREKDLLLLQPAAIPSGGAEPVAQAPSLLSFDDPPQDPVQAGVPSTAQDMLLWDPDPLAAPTPAIAEAPALEGSVIFDVNAVAPNPDSKDQKWRMVVMDEAGKQTASLGFSLADKELEQQLKRFYEEKYISLRAQVEATDRKALEFLSRVRALEARLEAATKERDDLQFKITQTSSDLGRNKEELDTTRDNYEAQLKLMTEHLVGLNDRIGGYEESLSTLHNCKVRCGKCSTWNSVQWLLTEGKMGQRCSKGNHPSSFNYA